MFSQKCLIGKLILECEDEILNRTENLFNDKKAAYSKSNCLLYTISLITIWLLFLVVICVSCYFIVQNIDQNKNIYYHFKTSTLN